MVEYPSLAGVFTMALTPRSAVPILQAESRAPGTSLAYITIGAIMAVLAGTSYFFFDGNAYVGYIRTSFLVLGIVLMVIGFTVGHIGRAARKAEVPPPEAMNPAMR
jgi:hypothetical protein